MTNESPTRMPAGAVAIIGAGPGGLAAAAWLLRHGFEPVIFEAAHRLGGQWNISSPMSGAWPGMRTNTSRVLTAFSDLDHAPGTAVYPTQPEVLDYLHRYAEQAGIATRIRLSTRVEKLSRDRAGEGWLVQSRRGGTARLEHFARAVVATGRYTMPQVPEVPGLASFTGAGGAMHSMAYGGPAAYRDRSVLVAGCSISALEIASELALAGAARVTVAYRRQRYIFQKLLAGVPTDHIAFTRFAALAGAALPPAMVGAGLKQLLLSRCGSPEQFGAPKPEEDIFAAGISQSQHFLALVAEGRIRPRPWISRIAGQEVTFADGATESVDAILFGTGYRLSLPFLAPEIVAALGVDDRHIDLHDHTFHPDLPGLAFIGLFDQVGPLFPVLELQARWLAYAWAGLVPPPSDSAMRAGLARCRARRGGPQEVPMHAMAVLFARHAQVEPDPAQWPALQRALLFGPLSPASFRLQGPDRRADAPARTAEAAAAFGCVTSPEMTPEEAAQWEAVRRAMVASAA